MGLVFRSLYSLSFLLYLIHFNKTSLILYPLFFILNWFLHQDFLFLYNIILKVNFINLIRLPFGSLVDRINISAGKNSSLTIFIMLPTLISFHYRFSIPFSVTTLHSLEFSTLSDFALYKSSYPSFMIDIDTIIDNGTKDTGIPPVVEIAGIIDRPAKN